MSSSPCYGGWGQYLYGTWPTKAEATRAKLSVKREADYRARNNRDNPRAKSDLRLRVRKIRNVYIVEKCGGTGLGKLKSRGCGCAVRKRKK